MAPKPRALYAQGVPAWLLHLWLACALLAAWPAWSSAVASAQVQGCGDDADEIDGDYALTPEDGAQNVARNAPIRVRYADDVDLDELRESLASELDAEQPVPCAGELVCVLETEDGRARVIEADVATGDNRVVLTPREPLAASAEHTVLAVQPGLDIVARAESRFDTGARTDRQAPVLDYGADEIKVSIATLPPQCKAAAGSRRVVLELPPATDDGDPESVTLEVLLLDDDGEGELRARAQNDGDPVLVSFILTPEEVSRRTCLLIRARDALGRASEGEPRVCFNPSSRPLFSSACSAAPGARRNPWGGFAWFLLLGLLARAASRKAL
jgi:hypothetical protein